MRASKGLELLPCTHVAQQLLPSVLTRKEGFGLGAGHSPPPISSTSLRLVAPPNLLRRRLRMDATTSTSAAASATPPSVPRVITMAGFNPLLLLSLPPLLKPEPVAPGWGLVAPSSPVATRDGEETAGSGSATEQDTRALGSKEIREIGDDGVTASGRGPAARQRVAGREVGWDRVK